MREVFLYGAATSAHQVEGNNVQNDWWEWEQGRKLSLRSGRACDHYRLFREDFKLARKLGHNAHRFSVEWSRIEPEKGVFDRQAIAHYRQVLAAIREEGMEPLVTLWHFTLPLWLARRGGWEAVEAAERFSRYVAVVMDNLGNLADLWVTLNEPMVYAEQAYWHGNWPPQEKNGWKMRRVINNLARGHNLAYRVMKRKRPDAGVGIAKNYCSYVPEDIHSRWENLGVNARHWWFNHHFFNLTEGAHDFIGVNYYFQHLISRKGWRLRVKEGQGLKTDLDWPVRPDGLRLALVDYGQKYGLPLYVTENGLADADDNLRSGFIRDHLRAVEVAQREGAKVRGYFHWSLMDNFEWAEGFTPRFGLVEVDLATMERKVRPSAYVYKGIIEGSRN